MKNSMTVFLAVMLTLTVTAKDKEGDTPADSDNTATVALSGTVYDSDSGELPRSNSFPYTGNRLSTETAFPVFNMILQYSVSTAFY